MIGDPEVVWKVLIVRMERPDPETPESQGHRPSSKQNAAGQQPRTKAMNHASRGINWGLRGRKNGMVEYWNDGVKEAEPAGSGDLVADFRCAGGGVWEVGRSGAGVCHEREQNFKNWPNELSFCSPLVFSEKGGDFLEIRISGHGCEMRGMAWCMV
jgi:hypothetical protein